MKNKLHVTALLALGAVMLSGCKHDKPPEGTETEKVIQTADCAAVVDTLSVNATVAKIDIAKRAVTLKGADGSESTFTASKAVDLNNLKVGDKVHATVTEEIAVYLSKGGAPVSVGEAGGIALTTSADSRQVIMASSAELTAKVTAVDAASRKVTLKFVDGSSKTIKVGKNIDLANVKIGDDVVARVAEGMAIEVTSK